MEFVDGIAPFVLPKVVLETGSLKQALCVSPALFQPAAPELLSLTPWHFKKFP